MLRPVPQLVPSIFANVNASEQDRPVDPFDPTIFYLHKLQEVSMLVSPPSDGSADMVFCAFMRYPRDGFPKPYQDRVSIGRVNDPSSWSLSSPETPKDDANVAFDNLGDPVLASNPSSSGFHPHRVYLAGTSWKMGLNNGVLTPGLHLQNQITVWHYDAGTPGASWVIEHSLGVNPAGGTSSAPTIAPYLDDKPAIAVSQFGDSRGNVYVAYLHSDQTSHVSADTIRFASAHPDPNNPFNDIWETPVDILPAPHFVNAPQGFRLNVDSTTGSVYLSWLDWFTHKLNVMVLTYDQTLVDNDHRVWLGPYQPEDPAGTPAERLLFPPNNAAINTISCPTPSSPSVCINSVSFLSTSESISSQSVALVYPRRKLSGAGTPIEGTSEAVMRNFKFHPATSTAASVEFTPARPVADFPDSNHNEWQPVVACGTDATCVVSYYASGDNSTANYNVYARRVTDQGNAVIGETTITLNGSLSDPQAIDTGYMEYQDAAFRNGKWYTASIVLRTRSVPDSAGNHICADVELNAMTTCQPAVIDSQPVAAPATIGVGGSATLSIGVSGTSPTIQWHTSSGANAGSGASVSVNPTATTTYYATVSNGCTPPYPSSNVTVTVCGIDTQPQSQSIGAGQPVTLGFHATCTALAHDWFMGNSGDMNGSVLVSSNATINVSPASPTNYWVQVTFAGGIVENSNTAMITILSTPTALSASFAGGGQINVTWQSNAAQFLLERCSASGCQTITVSGTPVVGCGRAGNTIYIDCGLAANTTYVYRIAAADANGHGFFSVPDLATTMFFTDIQPNMLITYLRVEELLTALNVVRAAHGDPTRTWNWLHDNYPSFGPFPIPGPGVLISAAHIRALRAEMDLALAALGVPRPPYTDSLTSSTVIKAVHFRELSQRAQ